MVDHSIIDDHGTGVGLGGCVSNNGLMVELRGKRAPLTNKGVVARKGRDQSMVAEAGAGGGGHAGRRGERNRKESFVEDGMRMDIRGLAVVFLLVGKYFGMVF